LKSRNCALGVAVGAIVVLLITAIVVVSLKLQETKHEETSHWSYHEQDKWPELCLHGRIQSPINLSERSTNKTSVIRSLNFQNTEYFDNIEVKNDGHSVKVSLFNRVKEAKPRLSGGELIGNFTLDNMHFHWPSEHTIDGLRYSLEAHLVFYAEGYDNLQAALEHPHAVTVVAILFSESDVRKHDNFRVIDEAVDKVSTKAGESTLSSAGITFANFFPEDKDTFFTYTGSLTTPGCTEKINWIIYKNPSSISHLDLKDLAHIYTEEHELLQWNNRLLQDVNERPVYIQTSG